MDPFFQQLRTHTRREFLHDAGRFSLGAIALQSLLGHAQAERPLAPKLAPLPTKAKAVIYLSMSGAPPALDMFDWKPELKANHLKDCPERFLKGEKFAFSKGTPKLLGSPYSFAQYGQSGAWVSEKLPHTAKIVDELCFIQSINTD